MKKILLTAFALSMLACSKKSSDSPAPASGGTNNNNTNPTQNAIVYDTLSVTFKGKNYYQIEEQSSFFTYSSKSFRTSSSDFGTSQLKPNFCLGLILPEDSSRLNKLKIGDLTIMIANGCDGYCISNNIENNSSYFFAGDSARYVSGKKNDDGNQYSRIPDSNNFNQPSYFKYKGKYKFPNPVGTTYTRSLWLAKGNFKFTLYNETNSNDSVSVQGTYSMHVSGAPY